MSSTRHDAEGRHRADDADPLAPLDEGLPDPDGAAAVAQDAEEERAARHTAGGAGRPEAPREQSVGRASALMASGTMVSRVLGLFRNALLLACIGTALTADSFNTANTLPNTIYMLLSSGLLTAVLIPQITKAMKRDDADDVVDRLLTACFGGIFLITVISTALAAPLCYLYGLRGQAATLGIAFAYLCLPQLFFYGVYAVLGQVLNTRGSYAAFMWTPVLANVVQIGGMAIFLSQYPHRADVGAWSPGMVWLLAGTMTLGIVAQALALVPALRRTGFRWRPRWGFRGYGFRSASTMAGWAFAAVLVANVGGWVCASVMNSVAQEASHAGVVVPGLTIYQNAFLVFMLPHSIITTSVLTALYPRMSRAATDGDQEGLRRLVTRGLTTPSVALVPITAAALVLAVPGLGVMYLGRLMGDPLRDTAIVFGLMVVGLIPFGWTTLQQRFLFAVEDGRTNLVLQAVLTVIQVAGALLALVVPWGWAVATIAIGQTLGNLAAAVAFVAVASRRVGWLPLRHVVRLHVRLALVSTVAGLVTWGLVEVIQRGLGWTYLSFVLQLVVGGLVFVGLFLSLARLLHLREVSEMLSPLTTRLRRRTSRGASA